MILAKNIVRHSIVIHEGKKYMIETKYERGKCLLIPGEGPGKRP